MASESIAHSASWAIDSEPIRARGIIVLRPLLPSACHTGYIAPISVKQVGKQYQFFCTEAHVPYWPHRGVGHGVSFKSAESKHFFFLIFCRENICWPFSLPPLTAPLSFFLWPEKTTTFCNAIIFLLWFPREMTSLFAGNQCAPRRSVSWQYINIHMDKMGWVPGGGGYCRLE